jgi:hypothetical protein
MKRKIIVWYYKDKEPYRSRRMQRKIAKWLNSFSCGLVKVANNLEPMIKSFDDIRKAVGNFGKHLAQING